MSIRLIVNADDFGYFEGVSRGILEAIDSGVVTATGVMANGPALARTVGPLKAMSSVSVGVHLNATLGAPVTEPMRLALAAWMGVDPSAVRFPSKGRMARGLLGGAIPTETLLTEWSAQIGRCQELGLSLDFVNSHEHLHMLPTLYPRMRALARAHGIGRVRAPRAEWGHRRTAAGLVRAAAIGFAQAIGPRPPRDEPELVGLAPSGRIDLDYLRWRVPRLQHGRVYELMCHPGHADPGARSDSRLADYHDWEGELAALTSESFRQLLAKHDVQLVSYADLGAVH